MNGLIGQHWDSYRLTHLLGRGSFAEVYLGEHVRLPMQAALKIMHAHLAQQEAEAFQHEAQTVARLLHPNIVRILDFDVQAERPFLVLDYAPGGSLRDRHSPGERLSVPQVADYLKQAAAALQYVHDQRYIHGDVKP